MQEDGETKKAFISVNWVLSEGDLDLETNVALSFLDYLLAGTSAAPLVKAINDSGLGESIVGGGVDDTLRQATYSMGLKGVEPDDVEKVPPSVASACLLAVVLLETGSVAVLLHRTYTVAVPTCVPCNCAAACGGCLQQSGLKELVG